MFFSQLASAELASFVILFNRFPIIISFLTSIPFFFLHLIKGMAAALFWAFFPPLLRLKRFAGALITQSAGGLWIVSNSSRLLSLLVSRCAEPAGEFELAPGPAALGERQRESWVHPG